MHVEARRLDGIGNDSSGKDEGKPKHLSLVQEPNQNEQTRQHSQLDEAYSTWAFLEEQEQVSVRHVLDRNTLILRATCTNEDHAKRLKETLISRGIRSNPIQSKEQIGIAIEGLSESEIRELNKLLRLPETMESNPEMKIPKSEIIGDTRNDLTKITGTSNEIL